MVTYFAECLKNLNAISLYLNLDYPATLKGNHSTILVVAPGAITQIIDLPAYVSFDSVNLDAGEHKLDLKVSSFKLITPEKQSFECICGEPLAKPGTKWKQLPSEYWAELMDMWHCHKPHEGVSNEPGMYDLALNGFHPSPGLAYYSNTYFLIHSKDAHNCGVPQKIENDSTVKIMLWDLKVNKSGVIRLMLHELIDAHATYKFMVNKSLVLWVLNGVAEYTHETSGGVVDGSRVMYQFSSEQQDYEEIDLPETIYRSLCSELVNTNERMPTKRRKVGNWCLSYL